MDMNLRKTDRSESGESRVKEAELAVSSSKRRASADAGLSEEQFSSKGKILGLFITAAVFFTGSIAAPVSLHRTSSAASAEGIAPSVMVGAQMPRQMWGQASRKAGVRTAGRRS